MVIQYKCDQCGKISKWRYEDWKDFIDKDVSCEVMRTMQSLFEDICGKCAKELWDKIQEFKLKQKEE